MKKMNLNTLVNFEIPLQKTRVSILAILAIIIALWCLVLPPVPVEPLSIDMRQGNNIVVNSDEKLSITAESSSMFNYWNLPILKEETARKPQVIKPKVVPKKVEPIPPPQDVNPISIQTPLPSIQYMGQVMDKEQKVSIFLKVGEENIILTPNVPYNNTWMILENSPYQIVVQHIPDQQTITISK